MVGGVGPLGCFRLFRVPALGGVGAPPQAPVIGEIARCFALHRPSPPLPTPPQPHPGLGRPGVARWGRLVKG